MVRHNQPRQCDHAWKEIGGRVDKEADVGNWLIKCLKCGKVEPFFDVAEKRVTETNDSKPKYDDREVDT